MFKAILCVLVLAVAVSATVSIPEEDMQAIFTGYMTRMNKVYDRSQFFNRYNIFKAEYAKILAHNELPEGQNFGVKMGPTSLTDLTSEEYHKLLGFKNHQEKSIGRKLRPLPEGEFDDDDSVDWTTKGAVNPIKDQGSCGSCWAFSAVAATETAVFLKTKKLQSFSEQQLVDCTNNDEYVCSGCDGCVMATAYRYIMAKGLCTDKKYPYTGADDDCKEDSCGTLTKISSYKNVTCGDPRFCDAPVKKANETSIVQYVQQGVVSIAIEADMDIFKNYDSGIIDDAVACGTDLDHGVAIVGYGTENGKKYWKVRNSWGASWGDKGYVRIAQGKNMCGIAQYAEQPYA